MFCSVFLILGLCWFTTVDEPDLYLKRSAASWAHDLTQSEARVRRASLFALGKLGKSAVPFIGQIKTVLLSDGDAGIRGAAASTLGELGAWAGPDIVTILLQSGAQEKDLAVRRPLALAWGKLGAQAVRAEPLLVKALDETDPVLKQNSAWALGQLGSYSEPTLLKLMSLGNDADAGVRREVVTALGNVGSQAQEAIPLLTRALGDPDSRVQEQAALALRKMGALAQSSISALLTLAENQQADRALRQTALLSIETIWPTGLKAPDAWSRLQALAQHTRDEAVQQSAQQAEKKVAAMRQK